jgi:hypothetical protein
MAKTRSGDRAESGRATARTCRLCGGERTVVRRRRKTDAPSGAIDAARRGAWLARECRLREGAAWWIRLRGIAPDAVPDDPIGG